jgi:hypothetical protein
MDYAEYVIQETKFHAMFSSKENSKKLHKLGVKEAHTYVWAYQYEKFRYVENKRKPMRLVPKRSWAGPDDTIYPAYTILELLDALDFLYKSIDPEYSKVVFYKLIDGFVVGKDFNSKLTIELSHINKGK